METSLHRELKRIYAGQDGETEVALNNYRIDVMRAGELIEIQHGSLAAIRDKILNLLPDNRMRIVKPIIAEKILVKQSRRGGKTIDRRRSPKRCTILDLFDDLVYFTRVFPHENLTLEVPLVEIEELRYPGHGRRRRRRTGDFQIEDQRLLGVRDTFEFNTANELLRLLPDSLPVPFDTAQLARVMNLSRWTAQRIAYCLRETGATHQVGKSGNTRLYRRAA